MSQIHRSLHKSGVVITHTDQLLRNLKQTEHFRDATRVQLAGSVLYFSHCCIECFVILRDPLVNGSRLNAAFLRCPCLLLTQGHVDSLKSHMVGRVHKLVRNCPLSGHYRVHCTQCREIILRASSELWESKCDAAFSLVKDYIIDVCEK